MRKRSSAIGGQAVLEGVMMRGTRSIATAVRDEEGKIVVESQYIKPVKEKNFLFKTPIIRGFINFISSMVVGMKTLLRSGEVFGEDAEPSKFETWLAKKTGINIYDVVMGFSVILGIALSLFLFFFLPQATTSLIVKLFKIPTNITWVSILVNLLEGIIRIAIFVLYIFLTTLLKDVRRTYMYHGAEHKTISCYEQGLEMTVENAKKMTTVHDRCGTTFMFIVMVISVLIFSLTGWTGDNLLVRFLIRIALLPIVSGVSYEILKIMAKFDNPFVRACKAPGLLLQKLTTKEPTDDMLEVALTAFLTVLKMDEDQTIEPVSFDVKLPLKKHKAEFDEKLKKVNADSSESEWIFAIAMKISRSEVKTTKFIKESQLEIAKNILETRLTGKPLWKIVGNTDFYGYEIDINEDVLSPRPETEELCENAIKCINENSRVLDLCTGSGCISVAIAKKTNAKVVAVDISEKALAVAKKNVEKHNLQENIELVQSDMFEKIDGKFDVIISNPPYISSSEIETLDKEVKEFDPLIALDGGMDGLDFYRIIANNFANYLNDNGILLLECGENQADKIKELFLNFDVEIKKDLNGIDRMIIVKVNK